MTFKLEKRMFWLHSNKPQTTHSCVHRIIVVVLYVGWDCNLESPLYWQQLARTHTAHNLPYCIYLQFKFKTHDLSNRLARVNCQLQKRKIRWRHGAKWDWKWTKLDTDGAASHESVDRAVNVVSGDAIRRNELKERDFRDRALHRPRTAPTLLMAYEAAVKQPRHCHRVNVCCNCACGRSVDAGKCTSK